MEEVAGSNPASSTNFSPGRRSAGTAPPGRLRCPAAHAAKIAVKAHSRSHATPSFRTIAHVSLLAACLIAAAIRPPAQGAAAVQRAAGGAGPQPGPGAPSVQPYDLTVLVLLAADDSAQVALSYSHPVDHEALRSAIQKVAHETGAQVSGVGVHDGPLAAGSRAIGTSAGFAARGLVRRDTGFLPVGPIAQSLPSWHHMRLTFVVGEDFPFGGPISASGDGLSIRLVEPVAPYDYDVERISGTAAAANVPRPAPPPPASGPSSLVAGLVGVGAGFLLGWLVPLGRRARPRHHASQGMHTWN